MFRITQKSPNTWIMTVPTLMAPNYKVEDEFAEINLLDSIVRTVVEELKERIGVRRMSYDTWYWTNHHEMERFITYYYLKYGNQYPIDRTTI